MMRVLFLHSGNLWGGVETALVSLASYRQLEPELQVVFGICFDDGAVASELRAAGAEVLDLTAVRMSRPWTVVRARSRLRQVLRSREVDACVTTSAWVHGVFAAVVRASGLRLVLWAHDVWSRARWLDRLAARWPPDLVVANSSYTARSVRSFFSDVPVKVIYCPLGTEPKSTGLRHDRLATRTALATEPDDAVVIQVGRMEPWKGHALLLDALGRLPPSGWRCWIVGGAQRQSELAYVAGLRRQAEAAGIADRVRFTGQRTDVGDLLAAADVFCQPNASPEPFGLVYVEALRAGLPVVGTREGGVTEIVDESCGRLVAPGDVAALASTLRELIGSAATRQRLGGAGPGRARLLCDPGARLREWRLALESLRDPAV